MTERNKFLITVLFVMISIINLLIIIYIYLKFESKVNLDIYEAIEASNQKTKYKTILLGDSVSRQLFNVDNQKDSQYYHLTSNQAIGALGNYLLLKNYLKNNTEIKKIYYIVRPYSLGNNLNQTWTYGYFVLPFLSKEENLKYLNELSKRTEWRENNFFLKPVIIKFLEKNPNFIIKFLKVDLSDKMFDYSLNNAYLSEITIVYLNEIKKLCIKKDIKFRVLASPMSKEYKNDKLENLKLQIKENNFEEIFSDYFESLNYYPSNYFIDGVHFKKEILEKEIKNIQEIVIKDKKEDFR